MSWDMRILVLGQERIGMDKRYSLPEDVITADGDAGSGVE